MPSHDELRARLFLLHAAEPPAPAIHHYVAVHGPVNAVAQIRHGTAPAAMLSEVTRPNLGSTTTCGPSTAARRACSRPKTATGRSDG
jgi:hypothetical protein